MAVLERVCITPMRLDKGSCSNKVAWLPLSHLKPIQKVPHIFFDNGEPWRAVNAYAVAKLEGSSGNNAKTVTSYMGHLKAYACWLEDQNIDWRHFPKRKKERCLFLYRGFIITQRDAGLISPSTTTSRMAAIINFYRWAQIYGWVERRSMWDDQSKTVQLYTSIGFSRTMSVLSSELAIPNRKRPGDALEDGLLPLTDENRAELLSFLFKHEKVELYLMIMIGFFTGARSETIRTLRLSNIENSLDDPTIPSMKRICVGPGTGVKTKYDVNGSILVPSDLVDLLYQYAYSARRLARQALTSDKNRTLLFLSNRGNFYSDTSFTKLISYMRENLAAAGFHQFHNFKFHQTRATFGTMLMRIAMNTHKNQVDAIVFVRDAMLHKHESTTWKYIKFIEKEPLKESLSEEFFNIYTGKNGNIKELIDKVTYNDNS